MAKTHISSLLTIIFLSLLSLSISDSVHDLLLSQGLPSGLLPKTIKNYTLDQNGFLQVYLEKPCLAHMETRVFFESSIRANISYGELTNVTGFSQEELFLWLPVIDIKIVDPKSGLIFFDIGVAHKQLMISTFEVPPDCEPVGQSVMTQETSLLIEEWDEGTLASI